MADDRNPVDNHALCRANHHNLVHREAGAIEEEDVLAGDQVPRVRSVVPRPNCSERHCTIPTARDYNSAYQVLPPYDTPDPGDNLEPRGRDCIPLACQQRIINK